MGSMNGSWTGGHWKQRVSNKDLRLGRDATFCYPVPVGGAGTAFAQQLKRTFNLYRMYGEPHSMCRAAEADIFRVVREGLDADESLVFRFEAQGLVWNDEFVLEDVGEDSLTRPLFADGVRTFELRFGLPPTELADFVRFWFQAISGRLPPDHSFATLVWEHEFEHVQVGFRAVLTEDGSDQTGERVHAAQRILEGLTTPGTDRVTRTQPVDALGVIQAVPGFSEWTREELDQASIQTLPQTAAPTGYERGKLQQGMRPRSRGAGQRVLWFLWKSMPWVDGPRWLEVEQFLGRIVNTLIDEDRIQEIKSALDRVLEDHDQPESQRRWISAILTGSVVDRLVERCDAEESAALLKMVPLERIPRLVRALPNSRGLSRQRLESVIIDRRPSVQTWVGWIADASIDESRVWLSIASRLSEAHRDALLRVALVSEHPDVRAAAVDAIRASELDQYRGLLARNLETSKPSEEDCILRLLVRAKDPWGAELAARRLEQPSLTVPERLECIRCLGSVRGPRALETLIEILESSGPKEERKAAALALSHFDEPRAGSALQHASGGLFADRGLKEACRTALRRRSARSGEPA